MSNTTDLIVGATVDVVVFAVTAGVIFRLWGLIFSVPQRLKVLAYQRGVVLRDGRTERVVGPGLHWIKPRQTLVLCDMRPRPFQVSSQELVAADGMAVRISLGGEQRIVDPAAFVRESSDGFGTFYLELRQALRITVSEHDGDSIVSNLEPIPHRIRELLVPRAAHLGLEIATLDVSEAVPLGWVRQQGSR